jgi:hypothetical protein
MMTINIDFATLKIMAVSWVGVYTVVGGNVKEAVFFHTTSGINYMGIVWELSDNVSEADFKAHYTPAAVAKVEAITL